MAGGSVAVRGAGREPYGSYVFLKPGPSRQIILGVNGVGECLL